MKILYFTATGNNLYIAKHFEAELLSIPQLVNDDVYNIEDDAVGIVYPVYYGIVPKMVEKYLKKATIKTDYLFAVCSYGSNGDVNSLKYLDKLLNHRLNYMNSVLMVDNYILMFDMAEEKAKKDIAIIDSKISAIKEDIKNRKETKYQSDLMGSIFANMGKAYRSLNKYICKIEMSHEDCISCQICCKVCPTNNIKITDKILQMGDSCEFCLSCVHNCKQHAISTKPQKGSERYINPEIKVSEIIKSNSS